MVAKTPDMMAGIISSWTSRSAARAACNKHNQKVMRAGCFANGSFGLYARVDDSGQTIGGPNAMIMVWHVVKK